MLRIALTIGCVTLGATAASAETWRVQGAGAGMTNVWQVDTTGGKIFARAGVMGRQGQDAIIPVAGAIIQGEYRLSSQPVATVPACTFIGKAESGNRIVGTASCGGQTRGWVVDRM